MEAVVCVTLWLALLNEVRQSGADECAMKSSRGSFRHLEAHGTGRKSGLSFVEIADGKKRYYLAFDYDAELKSTAETNKDETYLLSDGTSSRAAHDVSIALKYCTSQVSLTKRPAESTTLLSRAT